MKLLTTIIPHPITDRPHAFFLGRKHDIVFTAFLQQKGNNMSEYKTAIVIASTKGAKGEREDKVGPALTRVLTEAARYAVSPALIIADDREAIAALLVKLIDAEGFDLVLTSGGTGLSPTDLTVEATLDVAHREIPGLAEAMRAYGRAITPHADLSRAVVVQRGQSLIANLPGSPKGALENLSVLLPSLPHALDKIKGDPGDCAR